LCYDFFASRGGILPPKGFALIGKQRSLGAKRRRSK
jgi:hypothetical protein